MIQIIAYDTDKYKEYSEEKYKLSKLGEIQALDDFELCVIDLSDEYIWRYKEDNPISINYCRDLLTLKEAIINRKKSKILIVLPQNVTFYYNYNYHYNSGYKFDSSIQIKDNKENVMQIISKFLYDIGSLRISYEKTNTKVDDIVISADFNFIDVKLTKFTPVTFSNNSNKITTVKNENVFLTTLNISKDETIVSILIDKYCRYEDEKQSVPEWVYNVNFFNDEELKDKKEENSSKIKQLEDKNLELDKELSKNLSYKSILYTNGDELVKVVLEMLDEILDYDSSEFVDNKREDFLIKKEDITFVGEIKGLSSAVKNENVSQLDVHVQSYIDDLQKEDIEEDVKGLLIINHQRNKSLEDRQEVHEHQKKLAIRNGSLIIETITLLKIYEKYKLGNITKEECKKLFKDSIGLLEI